MSIGLADACRLAAACRQCRCHHHRQHDPGRQPKSRSLGTDLGTAVRHAESRLAAMRTALDMISRGAGFSWQPRGLLQGRGGPNARTGRARAPRTLDDDGGRNISGFSATLCTGGWNGSR